MAHELNESFNSAECKDNSACALGDFAITRQDMQLKFDNQANNNKLEDAGVLPKFDLMLANGDDEPIELKNPFKEDITTKQLKEAGVKATRNLESDGTHTTVTERKDGVKVHVGEGHDVMGKNGNKVHIDGTVLIEPNGKIRPKDKTGDVWVDDKGREVLKKNEDGSVTIDTGDGGFIRQDGQGVKKVSAIRSRDGKTFEEIDTDSPLGGLRPSDLSKPRK
jgi:hypothetical protein